MMHKEDAIEDLEQWNRFALAGRMQKPILNLFEDSEILRSQELNRRNALNLAVFMNLHRFEEVPLIDVFSTLCNFSYNGDIRVRWKMENPDKVLNIVKGQYEGLVGIYTDHLRQLESEGILSIKSNNEGQPEALLFRRNNESVQALFDTVPKVLKYNLNDSAIQLSLKELQGDLSKHLAGIVDITSIYMIAGGMYSTNPLKGIPYLYQKFLKGRK